MIGFLNCFCDLQFRYLKYRLVADWRDAIRSEYSKGETKIVEEMVNRIKYKTLNLNRLSIIIASGFIHGGTSMVTYDNPYSRDKPIHCELGDILLVSMITKGPQKELLLLRACIVQNKKSKNKKDEPHPPPYWEIDSNQLFLLTSWPKFHLGIKEGPNKETFRLGNPRCLGAYGLLFPYDMIFIDSKMVKDALGKRIIPNSTKKRKSRLRKIFVPISVKDPYWSFFACPYCLPYHLPAHLCFNDSCIKLALNIDELIDGWLSFLVGEILYCYKKRKKRTSTNFLKLVCSWVNITLRQHGLDVIPLPGVSKGEKDDPPHNFSRQYHGWGNGSSFNGFDKDLGELGVLVFWVDLPSEADVLWSEGE